MATVRDIDFNEWFPADYRGKCYACNMSFGVGEYIRRVRGVTDRSLWIAATCCGDITPEDPHDGDSDRTVPSAPRGVQVMPRGKTAADRCNQCFQIPASSGVCGCDG